MWAHGASGGVFTSDYELGFSTKVSAWLLVFGDSLDKPRVAGLLDVCALPTSKRVVPKSLAIAATTRYHLQVKVKAKSLRSL
jgi:hypothetical protein